MVMMKLWIGSNHILEYRHIWRWKKMSITICRPVDLRCIFNQNYQHIRDGPTILGLTKAQHGQLKSNIGSNMEVNVGQTPNWVMFDQ